MLPSPAQGILWFQLCLCTQISVCYFFCLNKEKNKYHFVKHQDNLRRFCLLIVRLNNKQMNSVRESLRPCSISAAGTERVRTLQFYSWHYPQRNSKDYQPPCVWCRHHCYLFTEMLISTSLVQKREVTTQPHASNTSTFLPAWRPPACQLPAAWLGFYPLHIKHHETTHLISYTTRRFCFSYFWHSIGKYWHSILWVQPGITFVHSFNINGKFCTLTVRSMT